MLNNECSKNRDKAELLIWVYQLVAVLFLISVFNNAIAQSTANFRHGWVFCEPTKLPDSRLEIIPAAYVVLPGIAPMTAAPITAVPSTIKMSESEGYKNICGELEYPMGMVGAMVLRNTLTGMQSIIMDNIVNGIPRTMIENAYYPEKYCRDGDGDLPCRYVILLARVEDTNNDNALGKDDALAAFAVDTINGGVTRITSPDVTVMGFEWIQETGVLVFTVRGDTYKDYSFTFDDGQELIKIEYDYSLQPSAVINQSTRRKLHSIRVYP